MARVQLIIPDEDKMRYVQQARREGLTFSAWLRAAAQERLREKEESDRFKSVEDLNRFFAEIDARRGPEREPDWEEHKRAIEESRLRGLPKPESTEGIWLGCSGWRWETRKGEDKVLRTM